MVTAEPGFKPWGLSDPKGPSFSLYSQLLNLKHKHSQFAFSVLHKTYLF